MPAFKYANNPSTTLSGAVDSVATSINATSGADFPATGKFTIVVDSEIMLVTGVAGTTWTVQRGFEGSAASAHSVNAPITGVLTRASLFSANAVDARSFGALGDGATNDAAAIQAAIDAASAAGGGEVFIPDGTSMLGSSLNVPANTTLRGSGVTSILKLMAAVNAPAVILSGAGAEVRDLKIDGNRPAQTVALVAQGVSMEADNTTVDNCTITNLLAAGIDAEDRSHLRITNNKIDNTSYIGIFVHATAAVISNILVQGNTVDRTVEGTGIQEGGIKIRGSSSGAFLCQQVRCIGNRVTMPASPTDQSAICIELWGKVDRGVVNDNVCQDGSMGISLDSSSNVAVTGNTCIGFNVYGIEIAQGNGGVGNVVTGNAVFGASVGDTGIAVLGPQYCTVSGNTIRGCTAYGIHVQSSDFTTVAGNTIHHTGTYAMNVTGSRFGSITGNSLYGGTVALKGIILDRSWHMAVTGNTIVEFTQESILLFSTTATDVFDWLSIIGNSCHNGVATQFTNGAALGANVTITHNPL